jgi:hypothetical protein
MRFVRPLAEFSRKDHVRNDIRSKLGETGIVEDEIRTLQWQDNLLRMDNVGFPEIVYYYRPKGKRDVRRPEWRWSDQSWNGS